MAPFLRTPKSKHQIIPADRYIQHLNGNRSIRLFLYLFLSPPIIRASEDNEHSLNYKLLWETELSKSLEEKGGGGIIYHILSSKPTNNVVGVAVRYTSIIQYWYSQAVLCLFFCVVSGRWCIYIQDKVTYTAKAIFPSCIIRIFLRQLGRVYTGRSNVYIYV